MSSDKKAKEVIAECAALMNKMEVDPHDGATAMLTLCLHAFTMLRIPKAEVKKLMMESVDEYWKEFMS